MEDVGHVFKKLHGLVDGHIQHIADALAFEAHFERFAIVALAVAGFARHVDIRQKIHLDGLVAIALAGLAASAFDIEGETPRLVGADFCFRQIDKKAADVSKNAGVSGRIGARCASERTLVDRHYFVDMFQPFDAVVGHGFAQGAIDVLRQNGQQGVVDEGRFSRTRNTGHTSEGAEGEGHIDAFEIIAACAKDTEGRAVALTASGGHFNLAFAGEVACGEGVGGEHLPRCPLKDDFPAFASCSRPDVDHVVGRQHHIFVVLHDHHGVAGVAELLERANESHVVALMQADGGFVEDVEYIDQLRADLCGQTDALTFTARKRHSGTVEGEVVQPDIEQKGQARTNLFENFSGDGSLLSCELRFQIGQPFGEFADVHMGEFGNVFSSKLKRQRLAVEPLTLTVGTGGGARKLVGPFLSGRRHFGIGHLLNVLHQSGKLDIIVFARFGDGSGNAQAVARSVENFAHCLFGNILNRGGEAAIVLEQHGLNFPEDEGVFIFPQRFQSSLFDTQSGTWTHFFAVDDIDVAQPLALGAGTLCGVEREVVGCWFSVGQSRGGTHQPFRVEAHGIGVGIENEHQSIALLEGLSHALFQALLVLALYAELVDDHFDVVIFVAVEAHTVFHGSEFAIDAHIEESLFANALKEFLVVAFALFDKGSEEIDLAVGIVGQDALEDLLLGVFHHLLSADIGVGIARTGIKQAEEVVDFGDGADRGARIFVRSLLLNADDGRKSGDFINVGAFEIVEEVARIGRKGFDVAALSFGIKRVESQRRLSAAAQPRDYRHGMAGEGDIDILQIVNACTKYFYFSFVL